MLNAAKKIGMKKPIIIRLKGTNVKEAKKLIAVSTVIFVCGCFSAPLLNCFYQNMQDSDFKLTVTDDLQDAAQKGVSIAEIVILAEKAKLEVQFNSA